MPSTRSSYGPDRSISTTMEREPLNIGEPPDFWKILDEVQRRAPAQPRVPQPTAFGAPQQARAMRGSAPQTLHREGDGGPRVPPRDFSQWTPRNFSTPAMTPQGVMGNFVNPLDVPMQLQGMMPTGFFTDNTASNYTYSPLVNQALYRNGPQQREKSR